MKTLLIEKLTILTLIYAFLMRFFFKKIYYFYESKLFKKESLLPILEKLSIYRHIVLIAKSKGLECVAFRSSLDFADNFFEKNIINSKAYKDILDYFKIEDESQKKLSAAVKYYVADYFYQSIRILKILESSEEFKKTDNIYFFNRILWLEKFYDFKQFNISPLSKFIFYYKKYFKVFHSCAIEVIKIFTRYDVNPLKKMNLNLEEYSIGYFPMLPNFHRDRHVKKYYFETIPYAYARNSALWPSKILHLTSEDVTDPYTIEFLKKKNIRWINVKKMPLKGRVLRDIFKGFISFFPKSFSMPHLKLFYIIAELIIWKSIVKQLDGINIYVIGYDHDFSSYHAMGLVAMSLLNKTSLSYTHGTGMTTTFDSYPMYDYFGVFSDGYKEIYKDHRPHIKEYFVCGPPRSDIIYGLSKIKNYDPLYKELSPKYKIVIATDFGGYKNPFELCLTDNYILIKFYEGLLELLNRYKDIYIIVALRSASTLDDYNGKSVFKKFFREVQSHPRIKLSWDILTYKLISMGDIIIANNNSTTGVEALAANKKVLFYDLMQNPFHHFKEDGIVATSEKELIEKFDAIYQEKEIYKWQKIRAEKCNGSFDGKCRKRIRDKILELL